MAEEEETPAEPPQEEAPADAHHAEPAPASPAAAPAEASSPAAHGGKEIVKQKATADKPCVAPPDGSAGSVKGAANFFKSQIDERAKSAKASKVPNSHAKNINRFENKIQKASKEASKPKAGKK